MAGTRAKFASIGNEEMEGRCDRFFGKDTIGTSPTGEAN